MHSGAITKNEAGAGGGVFVWNGCHFEMTGGEISSNKAKDPDGENGPLRAHEGGGIFTDAKDTKITGGSIINNETETTTDWGRRWHLYQQQWHLDDPLCSHYE